MYVFALRAAIQHVRDTGEWLVIVAPETNGRASSLLRQLAALLPRGATMGGRTVLFPEGGRLSVVQGSHGVVGTGYRVMFLGYEGELDPSDEIARHGWRQNAGGTAIIGGRPGELQIS